MEEKNFISKKHVHTTHNALVSSPSLAVLHLPTYIHTSCWLGPAQLRERFLCVSQLDLRHLAPASNNPPQIFFLAPFRELAAARAGEGVDHPGKLGLDLVAWAGPFL